MAAITADRPIRRRRRGIRRVLFDIRKEWSAYAMLAPSMILLGIFTGMAEGARAALPKATAPDPAREKLTIPSNP